ncbi:MAG: hypothetical protein U9N77_00690 [Thermodesulfobacteriota bacterium]|nr:hypothetical protein [Thermodesulfobacteriota bacterium]
MPTVSVRIDESIAKQADREAHIQGRTKNKQLEFWAKLGKAVATKISIVDSYAVSQGLKTIKLEIANIDSGPNIDDVFEELEKARSNGTLAKNITSATIYYDASVEHPGYLERVNIATGERLIGTFKHGIYKAFNG